jgi:signal transduction histidine kinase/CheY-like chemotaxis protein
MAPNYSAGQSDSSVHDPLRGSFLFDDNQAVRVIRLRARIREQPIRFLLTFMIYAFGWQLIIDPGLATYFNPSMAVIFVPHGAISLLVIGLIFFPLRMMAWPILAFCFAFGVSYVLMRTDASPEVQTMAAEWDVLFIAFFLNVVIASITATLSRQNIQRLAKETQGVRVDLVLVLVTGSVFVVTSLLVSFAYGQMLPYLVSEQASGLFGSENSFLYTSVLRSLFGGVIISAFFISAFQLTNWRDLIMALVAALPLITVGIVIGRQGFTPDIELSILMVTTSIMCMAVPLSYAIPAMILGAIGFVLSTNVYLIWSPDSQLTISIIVMFLSIILCDIAILSIRSHFQNVEREQTASVRRLNTVRNYAGVGVFAMNIQNRSVTVDAVTQRMMDVPPHFGISYLMRKLGEREQREIRRLMFQRPGETTTLLAQLRPDHPDANPRVIRLFFWYEEGSERTPVIYGLVVDVTGEHMQERTLKETLAELSMRQDQQKQLFSIISHELRSPASVISMLVEDIDKTAPNFDQQFSMLREASDQMMGTLTDMRQAVNPEKNLPVNLRPFVPADLAETTRNIYDLQAKAANVTLRLRLGDGAHETCVGDTVRIKQIVGNLIRNAIIHSQCTTITISYRAAYGTSSLERTGVWSVTDDGIGIRPEDVSRMFEPFQRGGDDARNRADGSGLGLYIVRSSSELLGGSVEYFPAPEGGAGYHIRLPEPEMSATDFTDEETTPIEDLDLSKLTLLLAEDNALVAEVTISRLEKFIGKVVHAENGRIALDMVPKVKPDLIITDLFMPEMAGDELTRILRREGFTKPIIGLTAAVVGDDMQLFGEAGASTVMSKPLEERILKDFIAEHAVVLGLIDETETETVDD